MAENSFLQSIKINKSFLDPLKNLYTVYHKRKKINEMLSVAYELVDKDNKNPSFNYKLAYALEINKKFNIICWNIEPTNLTFDLFDKELQLYDTNNEWL